MESFAYKGRSNLGSLVQGELDGVNVEAVADLLLGRGITPLNIVPVKKTKIGGLTSWSNNKIRHEDIMFFSRQLYTLLKAGVPILRALAGLQESTNNQAMVKMLREVREGLDSGRELSASLARHPKVFDSFYIAMVRVGELTGRLEEVFLRLFHHLEFEKFMREQIKSAVRYPIFVLVVMALAMGVISFIVIPAFAKVYKGLNTPLPFMTQLLIGFSEFMIAIWPLLFVGIVGGAYGFIMFVRTSGGRLAWDRFKLQIPVAGKIVVKATLARFSRSLALALKSGVPVVQGLTVTAQVVDNAFMASRIDKMREGVERGESLLRTAIGAGIFTPVVLQMVAVGEESGALDDLLDEIADAYQRETEYELKTLSAQIEPILIVFLGVIVLIVALGVFLPIWDLGKAMIR
ncbi:MAG TPA: type II secretion system F family protein [Burkholderiales bacterium]|nr:type II secretion system F family protein [Burkholderiales bacterium]